jgi:ubiquinone/menaquinone biosynthesis C-methylase UbiE
MQDIQNSRKQSAARVYESSQFSETLEETLHPGGLSLTARAAEIARLRSGSRLLDIASGRGTTACFLAERFSCSVVGIDLSCLSACSAKAKATATGSAPRVEFAIADAERLPFRGKAFDAVLTECSFSLLPNKRQAAQEIARVLKPGGMLVITDVYLKGALSEELKTDMTFSSCFSGAETLQGYSQIFSDAGFVDAYQEDHSIELKRIAYKLQIGYGSLDEFWSQFGGASLSCCTDQQAKTCSPDQWRRLFIEGKPGYALLSFSKPAH